MNLNLHYKHPCRHQRWARKLKPRLTKTLAPDLLQTLVAQVVHRHPPTNHRSLVYLVAGADHWAIPATLTEAAQGAGAEGVVVVETTHHRMKVHRETRPKSRVGPVVGETPTVMAVAPVPTLKGGGGDTVIRRTWR